MSHGPKFCPTPEKCDLLALEVSIKDLIRKLQLRKHFENSDSSTREEALVKGKSNFIPPHSKDSDFNSAVNRIRRTAETLKKPVVNPAEKVHSNITREEREALKTLKANKDIIIKTVDKGSAFVIMDTPYYAAQVQACLDNRDKYVELKKNNDGIVMNRIKTIVDKYPSMLTKKERIYIKNFNYKTANFVAYPKIHKSTTIQEEMNQCSNAYIKISKPVDLSFRFVTAGVTCPTSRLSELLDNLLKPYLEVIPSYIKDYNHFLKVMQRMQDTSLEKIILVTCDVKDMYSNITLDLGLRATQYWLAKHPELLNSRFPSEFP